MAAARRVWTRESLLHEELGLGGGAVGADAVFDGHDAGFVFTQRGVDDPLLRRDVAVDEGEVFFLHEAGFPDLGEFAGGDGIFGEEDEAGGFAVEAVDQVGDVG